MLKVYAIKDLEKGVFAVPFFVPEGTDEKSVIIDFKRDLKKGVMQLFLVPSNYELWFLCSFENELGSFQKDGDLGLKHCVVSGKDLGLPEPEEKRVGEEHNGVVDLDDTKVN